MTCFADPQIIACPHCDHRFFRAVLLSFNSMWLESYSDGGTTEGLSNMIVRESRCTHCCNIIKDIDTLTALDAPPKPPFWQRWFVPAESITYLPRASFDVYLELFTEALEVADKRSFAVQAYRQFNINYRMYGKEREATDDYQHAYRMLTDFILANPVSPVIGEYALLCADIYRLRGDFVFSKQIYDMVLDEEFEHIVGQGKRWCEVENTSLMVIHDPIPVDQARNAS